MTFADTDFCDPRAFDDAGELYAWLRELDHLHRDEVNDFYIAPRYDDVFTISRNEERYCCRFGVRPKIAGDMSIITLDGEEHTRQRRLINKGFTPRQVRDMIPHIRELTGSILDEIATKSDVDFVEDFAIHVPLIIICELMGLDPDQRMDMYRWSDAMMAGDGHVDGDDPALLAAAEAFGEFCVMAIDLISKRREDPSNDLISILTRAFDDGGLAKEHKAIQGVDDSVVQALKGERGLQDDELLAFLTVLLVAGNETTRNALTGGLYALSQFPEQKALMLEHLFDDDFMDRAVDELVRYVSPVLGFIRTVTEPHTLRNTDLVEGDRILMLYGSANRDDRQFTDPDVLDLTRDPNPHLGFGIGPHYCLGSNLARAEVKTVFQELLSRLPEIQVPEGVTPSRGDSTLVLALNHMPATVGAPAACPAHVS